MDYQDIRDALHEHFKALRERTKERIAKHGRLSDADKTALTNNQAYAVQALATNDYKLVGTDSEIGEIISDYKLPIKLNSDDYSVLRVEFLKAFRD